MTTDDAEPVEAVAGPSHDNTYLMQMKSQLHLCSSQPLQPPAVCLPVSVQQLTYDNGDFHDSDDEDDGPRAHDDVPLQDDGARADNGVPLQVGHSSLSHFTPNSYSS